jgi:hypothetical protein
MLLKLCWWLNAMFLLRGVTGNSLTSTNYKFAIRIEWNNIIKLCRDAISLREKQLMRQFLTGHNYVVQTPLDTSFDEIQTGSSRRVQYFGSHSARPLVGRSFNAGVTMLICILSKTCLMKLVQQSCMYMFTYFLLLSSATASEARLDCISESVYSLLRRQ